VGLQRNTQIRESALVRIQKGAGKNGFEFGMRGKFFVYEGGETRAQRDAEGREEIIGDKLARCAPAGTYFGWKKNLPGKMKVERLDQVEGTGWGGAHTGPEDAMAKEGAPVLSLRQGGGYPAGKKSRGEEEGGPRRREGKKK